MEKQYRLPKEFAEEWFRNLLSGWYKQGNASLYCRQDDTYCCLGVACDTAGGDKNNYFGYGYIEDEAISEGIPQELIGDDELPFELAHLNDTGKTFPEIVEWVKENVELY